MAMLESRIGERFGKLEIIGVDRSESRGKCVCRCDCGTIKSILYNSMKVGYTRSCGCAIRKAKHGYARRKRTTSLYIVFLSMKCDALVDDVWAKNYHEFKSWAEENGYVKGCVLTRINNTKPFGPSNCFVSENSSSRNQLTQKRDGLTSKYKGVSLRKKTGMFIANVSKDKITYRLGSFSNEKDAALAYNKKARELYGDIAYQNIIEED